MKFKELELHQNAPEHASTRQKKIQHFLASLLIPFLFDSGNPLPHHGT